MSASKLLSTDNPFLDKLVLKRKQDKLFTELDNETVILDMESGVYSGLDSVGTSIWNFLETDITFGTLCSALTDIYNVEDKTCRQDVLSFLKELLEEKLITVK